MANSSSQAPADFDCPNSMTLEGAARTFALGPVPVFAGQDKPQNGEAPSEPVLLPEVGETFCGFRLIGELGRGAFGRVYLARQIDLADRLVALKVSAEFFNETQTLAQLQHTNIVPIYSGHRTGKLQAFCMPYFGPTTLADIFRDLQSHAGIPQTGKHFVNTLVDRRSSTQRSNATLSAPNGSTNSMSDSADRPAASGADFFSALPNFELLSKFTFVEAVLWLGARLADGLTHAHERGVIHRDLKPANVLLADDGRPMLLDFNLASDPRRLGSGRGGTVPYMAPEQIRNYIDSSQSVIDGRADIYSLGQVLYELLSGRFAFPRRKGTCREVSDTLLADREKGPPPLRPLNPAVTPAVEAIIRRCLAFDSNDRYPSARALHEDLERQLANRPLAHTPDPSLRERLQKWARRHPRATSLSTLGTVAIIVIVALGLGLWRMRDEVARRDAREGLATFVSRSDDVRTDLIRPLDADVRARALEAARTAVAPFGVLDTADWKLRPAFTRLDPADQDRLQLRLGETLFLMAQAELDRRDPAGDRAALIMNDRAGDCFGTSDQPRAWWMQREQVLNRLGEVDRAREAGAGVNARPLTTATDHYLHGQWLYEQGRFADAAATLRIAVRDDPQHFWAWFTLGNSLYHVRQELEAISCYNVCVSINPACSRAFANRAEAYYRLGKYLQAANDAQRAKALGDTRPEIVFVCASAHIQMRELEQAEQLLTSMIANPATAQRAYFARAKVRLRLQNQDGADADRAAGMNIEPKDASDFNARGLARLATEPETALADFRNAETLNHRYYHALQNQAMVLTEKLNRPQEALQALNRLLAMTPDFAAALAGRAVLLARLGRVDEALRDARECLTKFDHPLVKYQIAGVYALTADRPGHAKEALRLLAKALEHKGTGADLIPNDPDLAALKNRSEFRRLMDAWAVMKSYE